ncbi:hypothetical protein GOP47_0010410 [Adiantum capillus-veneris]|uniref:LRAT domain-containing protein n=1 Tax=Adiantum capillus-veneris TaxID=13818 RepID=A0A9D4UUQ0_ADICA|nr:hypothetical protein GOP47_0010410 [Adiantum capillus-veneris]
MGFLSNEIRPGELVAGDHIYSYRRTWGYLFPHHGIFLGGDKVVHFMGDTSFMLIASRSEISPFCEECKFHGSLIGVVTSCLKCFLKGGILRRFNYGVGLWERILAVRGVCSMTASDALEVVLERASFFERKKTFGVYDVMENNCVHFAYYCKTGRIKDGEERALSVMEVEGSIVEMMRDKSLACLVVNGCNALVACFVDQEEVFQMEQISRSAKACSMESDASSTRWAFRSLMKLINSTGCKPLLLPPCED